MSEEDTDIHPSVAGIQNVRNPSLKFEKLSSNDDFTEYRISTKKNRKQPDKNDPNPFTNSINSFIFCKESLKIKVPTKKYMIEKDKNKEIKHYAYAVGMFPNPKTKKASYLDGCILAGLGLKRQNTYADVICFITPDISEDDKAKLEVVFDKVMYVPYISPYDMIDEEKVPENLKTIKIQPDIFKNCPNYTKNHPYVHVFFKLHIFNKDLFPYKKVCFVDSDLVPLNFYDSLFTLNCPAGFVEYRKKFPYLESFHWDRCDFLEHGKKIPKELTDIDKKTGADVNAGLLVVEPNNKEYQAMIDELQSPMDQWMGPDKIHKGFWSFDFDKPDGTVFVENSYCYPEQNYLTKRYSGKWTYIEFAFQSWALDPCNSFGIHMAAFNPKPWFKQPIAGKINVSDKYNPYLKDKKTKKKNVPITLKEDSKQNYDNISFSYEVFNELIIWGLYDDYLKKQDDDKIPLKDFFLENTKIYGEKISFDKDKFADVSKDKKFELLKNIKKKSKLYSQLSLSQQYISDLLNDEKEIYKILEKGYLQICRSKNLGKQAETYHNFKILDYYKNKVFPVQKTPVKLKGGGRRIKRKTKRQSKRRKQSKRRVSKRRISKRRISKQRISKQRKQTKRKQKREQFIFFTMKGCPYCIEFYPLWTELKKKHRQSNYQFLSYERFKHPQKMKQYEIQSYPTLIKVSSNGQQTKFTDERTMETIEQFLKLN